MQFLNIFRPAGATAATGVPTPEQSAATDALAQSARRDRVLVFMGMLAPAPNGAMVTRNGDAYAVAEATRTLQSRGGFAFLNASSREEAIEIVKAFLNGAGDGECELLEVTTEPLKLD
jgi:hypothetical protein